MYNKNFHGEVYFKVEHNYSVEIPGDKLEQIKSAMEADIQAYKERKICDFMPDIYEIYNSKYGDAKESALLAYAYYYGEDFDVEVYDNGYDGDDEDNDIQVRLL